MTKNNTVQAEMTMLSTFSPMLMPVYFFCVDPVFTAAVMDRIKARKERTKPMREKLQQTNVMMEKMYAHIAHPDTSSDGGGTLVVDAPDVVGVHLPRSAISLE